ncbi:MAG: hypothetical protein M3Y35_18545, partial [Actinomycetota bacterium]|nr:hypothetical protein [Actinomycetota bacterium]
VLAATEELLQQISPNGDLLDLAVQMRDRGVESLLFARPDGKILAVVTDRQIAYLAASPVVTAAKRLDDQAAHDEAADAVSAPSVPATPGPVPNQPATPESVPNQPNGRQAGGRQAVGRP